MDEGDSGVASLSAFAATWRREAENPFLDRYAGLDLSAWEEKVIASIDDPVQDGIHFPAFPSRDFQERMHGQSGEAAVREIFHFNRVLTAYCGRLQQEIHRGSSVLDFGTGWGRGLHPYMARVSLRNLYGYEATPLTCQVARMLNPYVTFVSGSAMPPTNFATGGFDVISSWSVFAHWPPETTWAWLEEFARILRPGGLLFITFWGERFVTELEAADRDRRARREVNWFHREVLDTAGDLAVLKKRCRNGDVVFLPSKQYPTWGTTFMSAKAAETLRVEGLDLVAYDASLLSQDLAVFRRSA